MRQRTAILISVGLLLTQPPLPGQTPEQRFADVFASVLIGEHPDGDSGWGSPDTYLKASVGRAVPSTTVINHINQAHIDTYGVLIVPGFLSVCAEAISPSASAYEEALQHLRLRHGVDISRISVPDDTSENNATFIINHLPKPKTAGEKYIVVGHSKGVPDLQVALQNQALSSITVALISIAGALHGSHLVELPGGIGLMGKLETGIGCAGNILAALESLRPPTRQMFLNKHSKPVVPSYSVVAESDLLETSRLLLPSWGLLGAGSKPEDGLLIAAEGTIPAFTFLGAVSGDHVAVAHNFAGTNASALFDKNHFPRIALLEALLRFVLADLPAPNGNH
jgi:hypothetical protein